jgi:hypothetical protein
VDLGAENRANELRQHSKAVIASVAKQSSAAAPKAGLLRYARKKQSGAGILPASGRDARSTHDVSSRAGRPPGRCGTRNDAHNFGRRLSGGSSGPLLPADRGPLQIRCGARQDGGGRATEFTDPTSHRTIHTELNTNDFPKLRPNPQENSEFPSFLPLPLSHCGLSLPSAPVFGESAVLYSQSVPRDSALLLSSLPEKSVSGE